MQPAFQATNTAQLMQMGVKLSLSRHDQLIIIYL